MSMQANMHQRVRSSFWEHMRTGRFVIIALLLLLISILLTTFTWLNIIVNPWPGIPWLTFLFRIAPLLPGNLGLIGLVLKAAAFSRQYRSLANRVLIFLLVIAASIAVDFSILSFFQGVPTVYSVISIAIGAGICMIAAILAIPDLNPPKKEGSKEEELIRTTYNSLLIQPIATRFNDIQQRVANVNAIHSLLAARETTILALTGMSGEGKSVLAELVYHEIETRRQAGEQTFSAPSLWLTIEASRTMADIAGTLFFEAAHKQLPDLHHLTGQNLAQALFDVINMFGERRLIVLDQFDLLIDEKTGEIRSDRHGVAEWLELLGRQAENTSGIRILLTCISRPVGPYPFLREYTVRGLSSNEGINLLHKQGVQGSEEELKRAVEHCSGHPKTLVLLKSYLEAQHMQNLAGLFARLGPDWVGETDTFLDRICDALSDLERRILSAFAIYREAMPVEAATVLLDERLSLSSWEQRRAINGLTRHNLLSTGDGGVYELHLLVRRYMLERYRAADKLQVHSKAAAYYLALSHELPQREHKQMSDINDLLECFWHYCQAHHWEHAYNLLEQEGLREDLLSWGRKSVLLELYHSLQPTELKAKVALDIYSQMGLIYNTLGQKEDALIYYQKALELCRAFDDMEIQGNLLNDISRIWIDLGKDSEAQQSAEQALQIGEQLSDLLLKGNALNSLGLAYQIMHNGDAALEHFNHALTLYSSDNDLYRIEKAKTLNNIGIIHLLIYKEEDDAIYNFEEAMKISREKSNNEIESQALRGIEASVLNNFGNCYNISSGDGRYLGSEISRRWYEAKNYYEDALAIRKERKDVWEQVAILNNLSQVCQKLGILDPNELEIAQQYAQEALEISQQTGNLPGQVKAFLDLGIVCHMKKELQSSQLAFDYYRQAWEASKKGGFPVGEGWADIHLGDLCLEQAHDAQALACLLCAEQKSGDLALVVRQKRETLRKERGNQVFPEELHSDIERIACQTVEHIFTHGLRSMQERRISLNES